MLIGGHVSTAGGLVRALERAEERGCETMQIFNQSPRAWRPTEATPRRTSPPSGSGSRASPVEVGLHPRRLPDQRRQRRRRGAPQVADLADARAVGRRRDRRGRRDRASRAAARARRPAPTFKKLGKAMKAALAADRATARCCSRTPPAPASRSAARSRSWRSVIEVSGGGERLGVCLDSCHLLASGYEVRDAAAFKAVVDEYDRVVGLDRLQALHLNDSKIGARLERRPPREPRRGRAGRGRASACSSASGASRGCRC